MTTRSGAKTCHHWSRDEIASSGNLPVKQDQSIQEWQLLHMKTQPSELFLSTHQHYFCKIIEMTKKIPYKTIFIALFLCFQLHTVSAQNYENDFTCTSNAPTNTYAVYRKNKKIGSHTICFETRNDRLFVYAQTEMKVKFAFLTAYKYQYVSREVWTSETLDSVSTYVNDNGKKRYTNAKRNNDGATHPDEEQVIQIPFDFYTTNHWNAAALGQSRLFNTITGEMNTVTISERDRTSTYIEYTVEGQLNINTRYDYQGNWTGMNFQHKSGSEIEFRCLDCKNTPEARSS